MIAITESRLTTKKDQRNSFEISNYCIEHIPTKSEKGGVLLYISKELNYKNRQDLNTDKDELLESVLIEVLSKSNKSSIIGCIYKHPKLALTDFTQNFTQPLLDRFSFENKDIIILGDFNIDLLHQENDNQTKIFLDHMYSGSLSQINIPTRVAPRSKILPDNIFTNSADKSSISGNLSYCILYHLAQ